MANKIRPVSISKKIVLIAQFRKQFFASGFFSIKLPIESWIWIAVALLIIIMVFFRSQFINIRVENMK